MWKSKVCNRFFTMGQGAGSRIANRRFQAMGELHSSCTTAPPVTRRYAHTALITHPAAFFTRPHAVRDVAVQVECERHILKPGLMFEGKGLKPVACKLWVNRVQRAPPHLERRRRQGLAERPLRSRRGGRCQPSRAVIVSLRRPRARACVFHPRLCLRRPAPCVRRPRPRVDNRLHGRGGGGGGGEHGDEVRAQPPRQRRRPGLRLFRRQPPDAPPRCSGTS
jgi:hypothetical protein